MGDAAEEVGVRSPAGTCFKCEYIEVGFDDLESWTADGDACGVSKIVGLPDTTLFFLLFCGILTFSSRSSRSFLSLLATAFTIGSYGSSSSSFSMFDISDASDTDLLDLIIEIGLLSRISDTFWIL